jgi:Hypothetical protein (DUF2513)
MRRDLNLVREALLKVEAEGPQTPWQGKASPEVIYNYALAIEAGLLEGHVVHGSDGQVGGAQVIKLTWAGHDWLDAVRSNDAWHHVLSKAAHAGGSLTFEMVKTVAVAYVRAHVGL